MRRGIRNLCLLLFLPLVVLTPGCEDLPAAPNLVPTAAFIYNPVAPINAGETLVTFNAVGTRDTDGTIASYNWSWGDGTPDQSTTSPTISHVFVDNPGVRCVEAVYAVLLTVVDDKGASASVSQQVKVVELPAPTSTSCVGR
jgi:hypothetical protein